MALKENKRIYFLFAEFTGIPIFLWTAKQFLLNFNRNEKRKKKKKWIQTFCTASLIVMYAFVCAHNVYDRANAIFAQLLAQIAALLFSLYFFLFLWRKCICWNVSFGIQLNAIYSIINSHRRKCERETNGFSNRWQINIQTWNRLLFSFWENIHEKKKQKRHRRKERKINSNKSTNRNQKFWNFVYYSWVVLKCRHKYWNRDTNKLMATTHSFEIKPYFLSFNFFLFFDF